MKTNFKMVVLGMTCYIFISFIISCDSGNKSNDTKVVNELCSKIYAGRMPGTSGNTKASEFIKSEFERIGLKEFINGYYNNFPFEYYLPEEQTYNIELELNNGEKLNLKYEHDFTIRNNIENTNLNCEFTFNADNTGNYVLITDGKMPEDPQKYAAIITTQKGNFSKYKLILPGKLKPLIAINEDIIKRLEGKNGKVKISFKCKPRKSDIPNVVGKITGKNSEKAIVISAHFDHVGEKGGTIYKGALDNASGVECLLQMAEKLIKEKDKLPYDVVFAAFNAEEAGLKGSTFFVNEIKDKYKNIIDINFDSLGQKVNKNMVASYNSDKSDKIADIVCSYLEGNGLSIEKKKGEGYNSDHESFEQAGYSALTIGDLVFDNIHTDRDIPENIDNIRITTVADQISKLVKDESLKLFEINSAIDTVKNDKISDENNNIDNEAINEKVIEESKKLGWGQIKKMKIQNTNFVITKSTKEYPSIKDVIADFKQINIPDKIGLYKFEKGTVIISSEYYKQNGAFDMCTELDKIYSIPSPDSTWITCINFLFGFTTEEAIRINGYISQRDMKENLPGVLSQYKSDKLSRKPLKCSERATAIVDKINGNIIDIEIKSGENYYFINKFKPDPKRNGGRLLWNVNKIDEISDFIKNSNLIEIIDKLGL